MHKGYFQGILQLRNPNDDVVTHIEKYSNYISKKKKIKKNGFNYYFISNKKLRELARKLKNRFGGILKESPKLFSRDRQTQKAIYRLNILFKPFDFKKNDIMEIDNKIIKITNIQKKISGINIKTNKKTSFILQKKKYKILPTINTRIIKIYPNIEVLDEDYQNVKTENKKKVELNEKIKVVFSDGYWLI